MTVRKQKKNEDINIFVMTWNTESVKFPKPENDHKLLANQLLEKNEVPAEYKKDGQINIECKNVVENKYNPASFLEFLIQRVVRCSPTNYDIIVIGLQEDANPGSYLLPEIADKILQPEYRLLALTEWMGVGKTTYKAMLERKEFLKRGLRLAVYIRNISKYANVKVDSYNEPCDNKNKFTKGKGSTIICLEHPETFKSLAICNMHLPFDASSLFHLDERRQEAVGKQNRCFNKIWDTVQEKCQPEYLIMIGDMNYRIIPSDAENIQSIYEKIIEKNWRNLYLNNDELHRMMQEKRIYEMMEGVNDQGPNFPPTCKMRKKRPVDECSEDYLKEVKDIKQCYNVGTKEQRVPSWCDRILFNNYLCNHQIPPDEHCPDNMREGLPMSCRFYNSWDWGELMTHSDHASVIASFNIPLSEL